MNPNEPLPIARFDVAIDGMQVKHFTAVDGLSMMIESLPAQEGAMHTKVTRKGRTKYRNLTLSRVFGADKELVKWFADCAKGKLVKREGSIIIHDDHQKELMRFNFRQAWPIAWEGPALSTHSSNEIAYETIVLDIEELELV